MAHYVYILECADGSYYTGITWSISKRVQEHNARIRSSLQISKIPVTLVFWEKHIDKIAAARREKEIKGWSRLKKAKLINSLH